MEEIRDIKSREDVQFLVSSFYDKIKMDNELGPFFNTVIQDWEKHIEHLTNFWESQLFMKNVFKGNPLKKHVEIDKKNNHEINNDHFGLWLNYWFKTLDELFAGERTQLAKNRARNMGTYMFIEIFKSRKL